MINMKYIIAVTIFISALLYPLLSYSIEDNSTEIDWDADISDVAIDLVDIHIRLGEEDKANGNLEGAKYHFKLAGLGTAELAKILGGEKLNEQEIEKIMAAGAGNCYIKQAIALCKN
jgi:hypothetical protein